MTQDAPGRPEAEVTIDEPLIRGLLQEQHPDIAGLEIRIMDSGWDNVMARLGDGLALRLPRRQAAEQLLLNEQRWLPILAPLLPLPIPVPVRLGTKTTDYPFPWSVQNWLPGEAADLHPPDKDQAPVLARFLRAVHKAPPEDAPRNSFRDGPLALKRPDTEKRLDDLAGTTSLDTPQLRVLWQEALEAQIDVPKTWIAGDVHARNVLVDRGKLSAFIDWGDLCAGDCATDLASIWALFGDREARREAIGTYDMSGRTLARARGWAVFFGAILLHSGLNDTPRHAEMGRRTLERLIEGED